MAKDPDQRYPTSKEFAQAARAALAAPSRRTASLMSAHNTLANPAQPAANRASGEATLKAKVNTLMPGAWAKVSLPGDDHHGQIGRVLALCEDDDDDLDVVVEFQGDPEKYAFGHGELTPVARPAERQIAPAEPPRDTDFWLDVGVDPIRIITRAHNFLTLRCYLDDEPIFLGHGGRINVFRTERALRRYLAGCPKNDMSSLCTYANITTAATERTVNLDEVTEDNVYELTDLAEEIAAGPGRIDAFQLELAVELLEDVGQYVQNTLVHDYLQAGQALGDLVASVLNRNQVSTPRRSRVDASLQWSQLEDFLESRLRVM